MKVYKVKVNGKVYEVELEAVEEKKGNIEAPKAQTTNTPVSAGTPVSEGANSILAPIAGKVVDVKVNVGDVVKKGQIVAIVEAMKLENEIVSQFDGKVVEIKVTKGSSVQNKDVLIVLG